MDAEVLSGRVPCGFLEFTRKKPLEKGCKAGFFRLFFGKSPPFTKAQGLDPNTLGMEHCKNAFAQEAATKAQLSSRYLLHIDREAITRLYMVP